LPWRQAFEAALRCIFSTTGDYLRRMAHQHRRMPLTLQTPPKPALRLCIIKPTGFSGLSRESYPCFSRHYGFFLSEKANRLNDALR
jgi:hypothetical protein